MNLPQSVQTEGQVDESGGSGAEYTDTALDTGISDTAIQEVLAIWCWRWYGYRMI